jgi:hypothetical protein
VSVPGTGGRWLVRLRPGSAAELLDPADEPDGPTASITGTAEDVFRAVWGRPSHAEVTGPADLLDPLAGP